MVHTHGLAVKVISDELKQANHSQKITHCPPIPRTEADGAGVSLQRDPQAGKETSSKVQSCVVQSSVRPPTDHRMDYSTRRVNPFKIKFGKEKVCDLDHRMHVELGVLAAPDQRGYRRLVVNEPEDIERTEAGVVEPGDQKTAQSFTRINLLRTGLPVVDNALGGTRRVTT